MGIWGKNEKWAPIDPLFPSVYYLYINYSLFIIFGNLVKHRFAIKTIKLPFYSTVQSLMIMPFFKAIIISVNNVLKGSIQYYESNLQLIKLPQISCHIMNLITSHEPVGYREGKSCACNAEKYFHENNHKRTTC